MSSVQTGISLQDNFSNVAQGVVDSMYNMTTAAYETSQAVSSNIDTSSIQAATEDFNQASAAMDELSAAAGRPIAPNITPPVAPPVVDGGNGQVINVDVNPVLPDPLVENPEPLILDIQPNAPPTGEIGQRIENIRNQLNDVVAMQQQIDQTAKTVDVLPDEVSKRMERVNSLIEHIQANLAYSVENPFGLGSNEMEMQLSSIEKSLNKAVNQQNMLNNAVGNTGDSINDNFREQELFNQEISAGTQHADKLTSTIKRAVAAYMSIQTLGNIIELSDTMAQTEARLNLIVDDGGSVEELQNKIYASAQSARASYQTTADAVSKMGMQASQAFQSNDELIAFTELLNKSFVNAGTAAQGIDSVMLQLTQSMASGKLQGEELNAVLDNAAPIVQNIQKYLEEVQGIDASNIKDLASEGVITADVIKQAMFYAADDINSKFDSMPMTFSQIWTNFKSTALKAFRPVLQRLNDLANSEAFQTFVQGAIGAMVTLANILMDVFDLAVSVGNFIGDNWSIIAPVVYGIVAALGVYLGYLALTKAAEAASLLIKGALIIAEYAHAAAKGTAVAATTAETAAQMGLNTALLACPITWIIAAIIALVVLIYAAVAAINKFAGTSISATGIIAGVFAAWVSFLINRLIMIYNYIASLAEFFINVWTHPVYSTKKLFVNLADLILDFCISATEGFDEVATNLANAFIEGANLAIEGINWIIDALNEIPGVDIGNVGEISKTASITSDLKGIKNDLNDWLGEEPEDYYEVKKLDYLSIGGAWDAGYSFGKGIDESIANFNPADLFDVPKDSGDLGNYAAGIGDSVGDIADNTGSIADSMDVTEEDLKYLRDIAEQETVNRFTTAEITIEQTNNNNVSGKMDLDGVVSGLTDAVNEAVDIITEGVH